MSPTQRPAEWTAASVGASVPTEPLHDWEIAMLRGMIDEHRQRLEREKFVRGFWTRGRILLAGFGALLVIVLNLITLVTLLAHK